MKKRLAVTAMTAMSIGSVLHAATVRLQAALNGPSEVPATQVAGTGTLTATLDTETNLLTYHVEYEGLTGPVTAAHFHGPAEPGVNARPVVPLASVAKSPLDGSTTLTAQQSSDLLAGRWYFNLHTAANPSGKIRGQLAKAK